MSAHEPPPAGEGRTPRKWTLRRSGALTMTATQETAGGLIDFGEDVRVAELLPSAPEAGEALSREPMPGEVHFTGTTPFDRDELAAPEAEGAREAWKLDVLCERCRGHGATNADATAGGTCPACSGIGFGGGTLARVEGWLADRRALADLAQRIDAGACAAGVPSLDVIGHGVAELLGGRAQLDEDAEALTGLGYRRASEPSNRDGQFIVRWVAPAPEAREEDGR